MTNTELQKDPIKPKNSDKIFDLINLLEKKKSKIIKPTDALNTTFWLVTLFFLAIAWITGLTVHDYAVSVGIGIAGFSGLMAYFSFFIQTSHSRILEKRFGRVKEIKNLSDKDRVLIKALIKIKSKNDDIDLRILYMMDKEAKGNTFKEKSLIEILCK